jgi:hypothetical protein
MGSFRSQPDLAKHTTVKSGVGLNYASTHMCGTSLLTQDGEFTCRMHISLFPLCPIREIHFFVSLMDTEVSVPLFRCLGFNFC